MRIRKLYAAALVPLAAAAIAAGCGSDGGGDAASTPTATTAGAGDATLLLSSASALDTAAGSVTLPLLRGRGPGGTDVWYVVTDSSDKEDAAARGVNYAPKLANALGTKAVQKASLDGDTVVFPGTVDFAPTRAVTPSADGFPPTAVTPGSRGDALYSPLITTDGAVVLNASQLMNDTGTHDGVIDIDTAGGTVTLKTLSGFFNGSEVAYLRLDASVDVVSSLEESTYAPNLGLAPGEGSNAASSSRSGIVPIVNGARSGPDRQGLQAAVLGGGSPRNITESLPGAADYSPAWDVTPAAWSEEAIAAGDRVLVTGNAQIAAAVKAGDLTSVGTGPANAALGGLKALGAVSNCPTVAVLAG